MSVANKVQHAVQSTAGELGTFVKAVDFSGNPGEASTDTHVFRDINALKHPAGVGAALDEAEAEEAREQAKYHNGLAGKLVKNKRFEACTISFILFNALEIGWDSDYSARYGSFELWDPTTPVGFLIAENVFAAYFTFEITTRFLAYKTKYHCLCDSWFVFDSILVAFMVAETWLMPLFLNGGGPLGQLSILRLLRLLRITRIAKLMRAFPELVMIINGIAAAVKAVVWTVLLLSIVTYTWAILFTNEYHQGTLMDLEIETDEQFMFGSMGKSMMSLIVMGTILDDVTACADVIRSTGNTLMLVAFITYILINSFTIFNMLTGILVEVVASTSSGEKEKQLEDGVRDSIKTIFLRMDQDGSGRITKKEFETMIQDAGVKKSLADLEIKERQFEMYVELLFDPTDSCSEAYITFDKLINMILRLRPGTAVSALDFAAFRQLVTCGQTRLNDRIARLETMADLVMSDNIINAPGGARSAAAGPAPQRLINVNMFSQLERSATGDIINELLRRLGMSNLEEAGVPLSMMDVELQNRVRSAEAFHTLGVPQTDPQWEKETHAC